MADRRMKQIFREAADVARSVPPEFRQAAFDKAVEMLAAEDTARRLASVSGDRQTRVSVTGMAAPDALIDRSVEAVAFAANRLGMESVSADQVAALLNERFGMPTTSTVVAAALNGAGSVVRTVRQGQKTYYRLRAKPARKAAPQPTAEKRTKPAPAKRATRKRKSSDSPMDIVSDLVALGFFATARTTTDVLLYLEKQGLRLTSQQVAPLLLALLRQGLLSRRKTGNGRYAYWNDDSED